MIRAYHVIFGCYGFWLPNDPRGSWSDFVRQVELYRHGPATKTSARHSVAHAQHDREQRARAKRALRYPAMVFNGVQARAVARGFADQVTRSALRIHACAIMPDHVHLVVGRHGYPVEQVVTLLKGAATRRLRAEGVFDRSVSPWARGVWKVYLNSAERVAGAVDYVERNPVAAGLKRQSWGFVTGFAG